MFDMQAAIRRYAEEARRSKGISLEIRVGLNAGELVVRAIRSDLHMDYTAVGQTTHLAARMEQLATGGKSLLTADTLRLAEGYIEVKPLGSVPVKGLEARIEVFELTGAGPLRSRLHAAAARGLTRFVGREAELDQLRQAMGRASGGHGQVVAIVGEPGVGKSRLVWEVTHSHRVHGWLVLQAGSVSYGKATSYLPVVDLLKGYFAIEDRDDPRTVREKLTGKLLTLDRSLEGSLPALLSLLDVPTGDPQWPTLDPPQRRRRTLDALKRLLLRESQVQPLLVIFEDLHWIDSEAQALLDGLVESLPAARLLLLVNYRPEYQHPWGSRTYYTQLRLDPLPPETAEELLGALLGPDAGLDPLKHVLIASLATIVSALTLSISLCAGLIVKRDLERRTELRVAVARLEETMHSISGTRMQVVGTIPAAWPVGDSSHWFIRFREPNVGRIAVAECDLDHKRGVALCSIILPSGAKRDSILLSTRSPDPIGRW